MTPTYDFFHITTGDTNGIGLEVTLKSLNNIHDDILKNYCFLIWIHFSQVNEVKSKILNSADFINYNDFSSTRPLQFKSNLNFLYSDLTPAQWFEKASKMCLEKTGAGIITAPLSKQETFALGHKDLGHTDILKRVCEIETLFMGFVGKYFNVVLYTDHVPVKEINLNKERFKYFLDLSNLLNSKFKDYSVKLLGFNPHAGDQGLIGSEDQLISSWLSEWKIPNLEGPLPADSAFNDYFSTPSTYAAIYHDQGLIPFKMAHGFSGYHTTLGLPFIRTSVDHGTGKDIFNQDSADFTSMLDAIYGAIKIHQGSAI